MSVRAFILWPEHWPDVASLRQRSVHAAPLTAQFPPRNSTDATTTAGSCYHQPNRKSTTTTRTEVLTIDLSPSHIDGSVIGNTPTVNWAQRRAVQLTWPPSETSRQHRPLASLRRENMEMYYPCGATKRPWTSTQWFSQMCCLRRISKFSFMNWKPTMKLWTKSTSR